jgi:hypothetical protein
MTSVPTSGNALARHEESARGKAFVERGQERRIDPVLGAVVDVAIAYLENLGCQVAEAFLRETGVPGAVARRVLDRSARQRTLVPRRWTTRAAPEPAPDRET